MMVNLLPVFISQFLLRRIVTGIMLRMQNRKSSFLLNLPGIFSACRVSRISHKDSFRIAALRLRAFWV
jgi:hypothetical protein